MAQNDKPHKGMLGAFLDPSDNPVMVSAANPLPVNASVSASIAAFNPKGRTTLAVSNVSARVAFPTGDTSAIVRNTGAQDCYFQIGNGSVVATTSNFLIKAGDAFALDVTGNVDIAAITASSTTTLEIWTGTGLGSLSQAGGSSGSGGNVNLNQVGGSAIAIGQALKAASLPVTIASDQGPQNDRLEVSGSASSAAVLSNFPITDTTGYRSAAVQITAAGTTCTTVAEESNDGATWTLLASTAGVSAMTAVGLYTFNISAKQFRLRVSVYGSGSPAATAELRVAGAVVPQEKGAGTTSAITQRVTIASDDPVPSVLGTTSGAKVTTDANGTIQQYLRGLVTLIAGTLTTTLATGANVIGAVTQSGSWVLSAGSALIGKVGIDQTTPGTTNAIAVSTLGSTSIDVNAGNKSNGTQRVTLASDDLAVAALGSTSGAKVVTDANGTIQQYLRGIVTILIGTLNVAISSMLTTGGSSSHKLIAAASTNATNVKNAAGRITDLEVFNFSLSIRYLKLYDKASAPTVGTDTPIRTLAIPPSLNASQVGGITPPLPIGIQFSTGISYALTGGLADADTTAIAANDVVVNMGYV